MLKRFWKGRPRGLSELPHEIRSAPEYDKRVYLREALLSVDGEWYRLKFEDATLHFWRRNAVGTYYLWPEGPSFGEETEPTGMTKDEIKKLADYVFGADQPVKLDGNG